MSNIQVIWRKEAIREAQEARKWYHQKDPPAALRFLNELDEAVDRVQANPLDSLVHELGTRVRIFRRFPYQIIFRMRTPMELEVLGVMHGRRRPGYWSRRLTP